MSPPSRGRRARLKRLLSLLLLGSSLFLFPSKGHAQATGNTPPPPHRAPACSWQNPLDLMLNALLGMNSRCVWFAPPTAEQSTRTPLFSSILSQEPHLERHKIDDEAWFISSSRSLWFLAQATAQPQPVTLQVPYIVSLLVLSPSHALLGSIDGLYCLVKSNNVWQVQTSPATQEYPFQMRSLGRIRALERVGEHIFVARRGAPLRVAPHKRDACPTETDFIPREGLPTDLDISALGNDSNLRLIVGTTQGEIYTAPVPDSSQPPSTTLTLEAQPLLQSHPGTHDRAPIIRLEVEQNTGRIWSVIGDQLCWLEKDGKLRECFDTQDGLNDLSLESLYLDEAQGLVWVGESAASLSALRFYALRHYWQLALLGSGLVVAFLLYRRIRQNPTPSAFINPPTNQ